MTDDANTGGSPFVPSKRAAQISGYSQDYIGQLCRVGAIEARRVGGIWYINLDSLYKHKQKADSYFPAPRREGSDPDSLVALDGKGYISASRASEITGYSQDYVGQLAREGKVLSRQAGGRWYVDRNGIVDHKNHKDSLLAAVQAESVGLPEVASGASRVEPFFTYTQDDSDLLPLVGREKSERDAGSTANTEVHPVPIRVLRPGQPRYVSEIRKEGSKSDRHARVSGLGRVALASIVGTIVIVLSAEYVSIGSNAIFTHITDPGESSTALAGRAGEYIAAIAHLIEEWLVPEMIYHRPFGN